MSLNEYYRRLGATYLHKFGRNQDVDTGSVPEDVWDGGGVYSFPTAAATTTIVGGANDAAAGTGARTVEVQGLNSDGELTSETVTMNGATPVELTNEYYRVFRAKVLTAGSGGTNDGNIQVKHGATVLAQITAGLGQTLMAIYTVPVDYSAAAWVGWYVAVQKFIDVSANVALQIRENGGAWQTKEFLPLVAQGTGFIPHLFPGAREIPPLTDMRARATYTSQNNADVSAGFYLWLID